MHLCEQQQKLILNITTRQNQKAYTTSQIKKATHNG